MARRLDLSSAWAKLERAKEHVDRLRREIEEAGAPDPNLIPLRRNYDPKKRAVIYRIDRVIQVRDHWPLLVGDAIHDQRCALDHLMWQLAIVCLGRQPTEKEAKQIQFPEVTSLKNLTPANRFLKFIRPVDLGTMKAYQPLKRRQKGQLHPLSKIIRLSNIDKHRRLHLLVAAPFQATFTNRPDGFRDCRLLLRTDAATGRQSGVVVHNAPSRPLRVNAEIFRIYVRPTGPNPDVECDARLTGWVALGKLGPIIPLLDAFGQFVAETLTAFHPRP